PRPRPPPLPYTTLFRSQPRQRARRRRLSRPRLADKPERLAARHLEADAPHRRDALLAGEQPAFQIDIDAKSLCFEDNTHLHGFRSEEHTSELQSRENLV